jgi:hypothetical protein
MECKASFLNDGKEFSMVITSTSKLLPEEVLSAMRGTMDDFIGFAAGKLAELTKCSMDEAIQKLAASVAEAEKYIVKGKNCTTKKPVKKAVKKAIKKVKPAIKPVVMPVKKAMKKVVKKGTK